MNSRSGQSAGLNHGEVKTSTTSSRFQVPVASSHVSRKAHTALSDKQGWSMARTGMPNSPKILRTVADTPVRPRKMSAWSGSTNALESQGSPPETVLFGGTLSAGPMELPEGGMDLEKHLENVGKFFMLRALERTGGVQTQAAEVLGMSFRSFRYYAKKYNLIARDEKGVEGNGEAGDEADDEGS